MFGYKIVRESLLEELKGYYGRTEVANSENAYLSALADVMNGVTELPPMAEVSRTSIKRIYETRGPVAGVVNYIANNVAEIARYLELTSVRDNKVVEGHWLLDVLNRPNDRFTRRKFFFAWAVNKLLFGDAWVYAPKAVGKDRGRVPEMYVIPGHKIAAQWGKGDTDTPMSGVRLLGSRYDKEISFTECFESFDYNLDDTTMFGTSRIVAAATYLSVMDKGVRRQDTALANGGVANVVTPKPDNISNVPRKADADQIEREFNSRDAVNRTRVLRAPVEVHQLGNAPVDLNILESHKEAVTLLCFVYQIPVDLYYGQAKYENAKEAKKTIYEQCAIPMCNEFAEDLLNYLGLSNEFKLEIDTQKIDVLKASPTDVLDNLGKMGASLNERREVMGYDPIAEPYADQPMIPLGTQFGYEDTYDITDGA